MDTENNIIDDKIILLQEIVTEIDAIINETENISLEPSNKNPPYWIGMDKGYKDGFIDGLEYAKDILLNKNIEIKINPTPIPEFIEIKCTGQATIDPNIYEPPIHPATEN